MTLNRFILELRSLTWEHNIKWFTWRGSLRCTYRGSQHCPLSFVANAKFNTDHGVGHFDFAGAELGLNHDETYSLCRAADNDINNQLTRKKLLLATGVEE